MPILIERTFNVPVSKIWKAITDRDNIKKWSFNLKAFKPEVGFKFQFEAGEDPGKLYLHLCEVREVVEGKKISYTWRYDGYPGNSLVIFELFEEGSNTKLRLTHEDVETFPESNPDFARDNFVLGWTEIIGTSLKNYLEGKKK